VCYFNVMQETTRNRRLDVVSKEEHKKHGVRGEDTQLTTISKNELEGNRKFATTGVQATLNEEVGGRQIECEKARLKQGWSKEETGEEAISSPHTTSIGGKKINVHKKGKHDIHHQAEETQGWGGGIGENYSGFAQGG